MDEDVLDRLVVRMMMMMKNHHRAILKTQYELLY